MERKYTHLEHLLWLTFDDMGILRHMYLLHDDRYFGSFVCMMHPLRRYLLRDGQDSGH